jgi:hypothetical protein
MLIVPKPLRSNVASYLTSIDLETLFYYITNQMSEGHQVARLFMMHAIDTNAAMGTLNALPPKSRHSASLMMLMGAVLGACPII